MNILVLEPKSVECQSIEASSLRVWLAQIGWKKMDLCHTLAELKANFAKGNSNYRAVLVNDPSEKISDFTESLGVPVIWMDSTRKSRNASNGHFSLRKTFGAKALHKTTIESSKEFLSLKTELLYLGSNPSQALLEVMDAQVSRWRRMIVVNDPAKLIKYINPDKFSQVGAILVESEFANKAGVTWLRSMQSKPAFIHRPWTCLSVDPAEVGSLKTICEYFFHEQGEKQSLTHWNDRLKLLWTSHVNRLESDLLTLTGKEHLRKEQYEQAQEDFENLRKLLSSRSDVLCYLGDVYHRQNKPEKSEACYRQSVANNPFNPHAYVKLLHQLEATASPDLAQWTAIALLTCEKHPQIAEILKRLLGGTVINFPGKMPSSVEPAQKKTA